MTILQRNLDVNSTSIELKAEQPLVTVHKFVALQKQGYDKLVTYCNNAVEGHGLQQLPIVSEDDLVVEHENFHCAKINPFM